MSAITEEDQRKDSVDSLKDDELDPQFYGGMVYKQNENSSLYHYGNTSNAIQVGYWGQARLIRDKCINLFKKYTNKIQ